MNNNKRSGAGISVIRKKRVKVHSAKETPGCL